MKSKYSFMQIKSNTLEFKVVGAIFEYSRMEATFTYRHLFNTKILISGMAGKNAPIKRSSHCRSNSASCCSLECKRNKLFISFDDKQQNHHLDH